MARQDAEFHYENSDGQDGFVGVRWGPWGGSLLADVEAPIMVALEDAPWMEAHTALEFAEWLTRTVKAAQGEAPEEPGLTRAEQLLREIADGKHSLPGILTQIERYFESR